MLNIGLPEMVVIAGIALVILGPEKFPTQAKVFLRLIRGVREQWEDVKREVTQELNPVKKELRDLQRFKPEELLDRMTGEDKKTEPPKPAVDDPYSSNYPYGSSTDSTAKGTNDGAVEFGSTPTESTEGRSEASTWERKDDAPAETPILKEEDEHRSAQAEYDPRPKDGSD